MNRGETASGEEPGRPITSTRPGGSLDGFTAETFASSPSVLQTTRSGKRKGLQQYFTPPDAALFIKTVVNPKGNLRAFDPTAGDAQSAMAPAQIASCISLSPLCRRRKERQAAAIPQSDPRSKRVQLILVYCRSTYADQSYSTGNPRRPAGGHVTLLRVSGDAVQRHCR